MRCETIRRQEWQRADYEGSVALHSHRPCGGCGTWEEAMSSVRSCFTFQQIMAKISSQIIIAKFSKTTKSMQAI